MKKLSAQIKEAEGEARQELIRQHKLAKQELLKTPCKSQTDKVIKYIRYADDCAPRMRGQVAKAA
jgi:hypothetical protein